jgi:hypothetical protein
MFTPWLKKIELLAISVLGFLSLFLLGRNSWLSKQNKKLNQDNSNQVKTIDVQKKVINIAKNTKPTDIDGNLKRMRSNKL